jgi:hypothetical protein
MASLSAAPVAVIVAGLLVWQGSNAAFTAETHSGGNNWETGNVVLTDDDAAAAMFSVPNLAPGQFGSHCIVVTSAAGAAGVVKTYGQVLRADGLQDHVKITIEQGTGGSFADCTGFTTGATEAAQSLTALFATHGTYGTGILPWAVGVGTESKTYKFSWVFDVTGLDEAQQNALQGKSVGAVFEWELQTT